MFRPVIALCDMDGCFRNAVHVGENRLRANRGKPFFQHCGVQRLAAEYYSSYSEVWGNPVFVLINKFVQETLKRRWRLV